MSIGNQKFGISRKYQNQIGIWYFCPKFLGIFLVFYRNFVNVLVKIWLNIGILEQNKIGLVFDFRVCHFIGIGLVSVCHFPENDISSMYTRLQTVWSLPGHSRQANKDHSPRCHRRPNGPGRLADKVVQPTTQSAEGCTLVRIRLERNYTLGATHDSHRYFCGMSKLELSTESLCPDS